MRSILRAANATVALVFSNSVSLSIEITADFYDQVIADPGIGLDFVIHAGPLSFPKTMKYINWLGDDEMLKSESFEATS